MSILSSSPFITLTIYSSLIGLISGCCDTHLSEATCRAEIGLSEPCEWSTDPQPLCTATVPVPADATCLFAACMNDDVEYNIQFILDESGSVGAANYDNSVDFVKELIVQDVNSVSPISVFSFSNEVDEIFRFDEDQTSRNDVLSALDGAKSTAGAYQGRCTDTLSALEIGVAEYERAANAGDLNSGDRFLFLITDGVPYCGCGLPSTCDPAVCGTGGDTVRNKITTLGIRIFTMGIGNFDITTIQCLSDSEDVFQVDGFTADDFKELEEDVRPTLCPYRPEDFMPNDQGEEICDDYLYIDDQGAVNYAEAQAVCDEYGGLAVITSEEDCECIKQALDGKEAAWMGLNSLSYSGNLFFEYDDGTQCPAGFSGACLGEGCWINGKPLNCDEEGGSKCVGISVDGLNNDVLCDETRNGILCNLASGGSAKQIGLNKLSNQHFLDRIFPKGPREAIPLSSEIAFWGSIVFVLMVNLLCCYFCLCHKEKQPKAYDDKVTVL